MGFSDRLSRAIQTFRDKTPDSWLVVEDMTPAGFRVVHEADSPGAAMEWRRRYAATAVDPDLISLQQFTYQIIPARDYAPMVANLMRDRRFWVHWGTLTSQARAYSDHLATERFLATTAVAERGPETGTLGLAEVAQRARFRHGIADTPARGNRRAEGLPEGVVWNNEEHDATG